MPLKRLLALVILLPVAIWSQSAFLPAPVYQVQFPPPPADGGLALKSVPDRSRTVLSNLACGSELEFFQSSRDTVGETNIAYAIAKLMWSSTLHQGDGPSLQGSICNGEGLFSVPQVQSWFTDQDTDFWRTRTNLPSLSPADLKTLSDDFSEAVLGRFGCSIQSNVSPPDFAITLTAETPGPPVINPPGGVQPYFLHARFAVSQRCMHAQINRTVPTWVVAGSAGTSDLPCIDQLSFLNDIEKALKEKARPGKETPGEWDVRVRDLTRLYYLDGLYGPVLDQPSHDHIRDDLLTLDRSPGPESYSVLQCGNTGDRRTGSPEQRADDNNWGSDALQSIGDALGWLMNRLIVYAAAEGPVLDVLGVIFPASALLAAVSVDGLEGASAAMIPESENHRLMIESSRYLNNRLIARELSATRPNDAVKYTGYADQGKEWLLRRMQGILANDFIEYNARPYQRYSVISLYNLYDFSPDVEVRVMAGMVLEYAELKFAMAGNQGRRTVPFRRLQEVADGITSVMESASGNDFQVSQMLFLAGQSQQLPIGSSLQLGAGPPAPTNHLISRSALEEMTYLASSTYRPDAQILDLAIRKPTPYYQRLAHSGGVEIYSGTEGYVISAGGIETDAAYKVTVDGYTKGRQEDSGTGVPTALIFAAGSGDTDRKNFLRIEGIRLDHGSSGNSDHPDWHNISYNHNTCVWGGFACGVNLIVPERFISDGCKPVHSVLLYWQFIDTTSCDAAAPKVYVAIYGKLCRSDDACTTTENSPQVPNQAFFEAVYNPADDFVTFQNKVINANPHPFDSGTGSTGTYHSYSGHAIAFDAEAHQHDTSNWGVRSVDGVAQPDLRQWPPAQGDIINATGDGHIVITFPPNGNKIEYYFSNWAAPVRTQK